MPPYPNNSAWFEDTRSGWNHWYHCVVGTYAKWLPGDPRGWRERHHHEHVAGDYLHPPLPSPFQEGRHRHAQGLTSHAAYVIPPADRQTIGELILGSLTHQQVTIAALAVAATNFHALVQCPADNPRRVMGHVKQHVTFRFARVIDSETNERRPLFAKRCGDKPIRSRDHQINTFYYILGHVEEGAWVWSVRDKPRR